MKPICIIPARGGSKRFPRKNIALLANKPLVAYTIEAALESNIFDEVCVSSEDDKILEISRKYGATLNLKRKSELASDTAQVRHVCASILEGLAAKGLFYTEFAVLLATNPFRKPEDIKNAYRIFKSKKANYVISLVPYSHPPQRAVWVPQDYVEPYFGLQYMKPAQLLDKLYRHDGSIIIARTEAFLRDKEFYGTKAVPYFINEERSVDIDNPIDMARAEFLISRLNRNADKENNKQ